MDPKILGQKHDTEEECREEKAGTCILNSNISSEWQIDESCLDVDSKQSISKQSQENEDTGLLESVEQCNKQIDNLSLNVKEEILVKVWVNGDLQDLELKDINGTLQDLELKDINGTLQDSVTESLDEDNTNLDTNENLKQSITKESNINQSGLQESQVTGAIQSVQGIIDIKQIISDESQVNKVLGSCEAVLDEVSKQSTSNEFQANEVAVHGDSKQSMSMESQENELLLDAESKQPHANEVMLDSDSIQRISNESQVHEIVGSCEAVLEFDIKENISKKCTVNEDGRIFEGVLVSQEDEFVVPYDSVPEFDIKQIPKGFQMNEDAGAAGISVSGAEHKDEETLLQGSKEVTILAASVLIPGKASPCPARFKFGTTGITMKLQNENLELITVNWLLSDINVCKFFNFHETCSIIIELVLSESGILALQKYLGPLDYTFDVSCYTVSFVASDVENALDDVIRQISALSDDYRSILKIETEQFSYSNEEIVDDVYESHAEILENWCDIVFPKDDVDPVTVTKYDYLLLNPDEFLSDTIVDFYIKYLQLQCIPGEARDRFYFYNSFFFRKLTDVNDRKYASPFDRVKRWTSKVNIFDKDYLFIPIMQNAHWSLVVICNPGYLAPDADDEGDVGHAKAPLILHLDSLEGSHEGLEEPIRNYILEAWNQKAQKYPDFEKSSFMKFIAARVPQQTNFTDCGLFLLHYVELFILEILQGHTIDFLSDGWFHPADASRKRFRLQEIIRSLQEEALTMHQNISKTDSNMPNNGDEKTTNASGDGGDVDSDDDDCIMEVGSSYDHHQDCQMQPSPCDILGFSNMSEDFHMLPNASSQTVMGHEYGGSSSHLLNSMITDEDVTAVHMMQGLLPGGDTVYPITEMSMEKYSRFQYSMGNTQNYLGGIGFSHSCNADAISNDGQLQMMGSSQMLMDSGWQMHGEREALTGQLSGTTHLNSGHAYNGELVRDELMGVVNSGTNQCTSNTAMDLTQTWDSARELNDKTMLENVSEADPNTGNRDSKNQFMDQFNPKEGKLHDQFMDQFNPKEGKLHGMSVQHRKIKKARKKSKAKVKQKPRVFPRLLRQGPWGPFTRSARRKLQSRLQNRSRDILRRRNLLT